MLLLAAKTLLTPLLLVACTIVSHRWGDLVGGWLLGLPLASGPVSVFLSIQHGSAFAAAAARSTLLGFVAVGVFCLTYLALARTHSWKLSLAGAMSACLATTAGLSFVQLPLAEAIPAVAVALLAMNLLLGRSETTGSQSTPRVGGVAARMAIAGLVVCALTTFSGLLGGTVTGLLAPLPVLAAVMAAAAHRREGFEATQGLLRGIVVGMWGGVAFFAVVSVFIGQTSQPVTYASAALAAGLAGWTATRIASFRPRLRLQQHLQHTPLGGALHRFDAAFERISLGD